jgi:hypothetical protein
MAIMAFAICGSNAVARRAWRLVWCYDLGNAASPWAASCAAKLNSSGPEAAASALTAESIQTQSQETARLISVRTKGISNENFLCACDHCNPDAVSDACACRYDLSDAAMSRVRRHRLYPDCGAMRDSGAIPSPQAIVAGSEAADILLLSIVPATNDGQHIPRIPRRQ